MKSINSNLLRIIVLACFIILLFIMMFIFQYWSSDVLYMFEIIFGITLGTVVGIILIVKFLQLIFIIIPSRIIELFVKNKIKIKSSICWPIFLVALVFLGHFFGIGIIIFTICFIISSCLIYLNIKKFGLNIKKESIFDFLSIIFVIPLSIGIPIGILYLFIKLIKYFWYL